MKLFKTVLALTAAYSLSCQSSNFEDLGKDGFRILEDKVMFAYNATQGKCRLYEFRNAFQTSPERFIVDKNCDGTVDEYYKVDANNQLTEVRMNKGLQNKMDQLLKDFYKEHDVLERLAERKK